jgi:hypothetical protein
LVGPALYGLSYWSGHLKERKGTTAKNGRTPKQEISCKKDLKSLLKIDLKSTSIGFPMIEKIMEMVSRTPETIMIGFGAFILAVVIVIILHMVFGLRQQIAKVTLNLNVIEDKLEALTYDLYSKKD